MSWGGQGWVFREASAAGIHRTLEEGSSRDPLASGFIKHVCGKARNRAHSAGLLDGREMGLVLLAPRQTVAKAECEGEAQEWACQVWALRAWMMDESSRESCNSTHQHPWSQLPPWALAAGAQSPAGSWLIAVNHLGIIASDIPSLMGFLLPQKNAALIHGFKMEFTQRSVL